MDTGVQVSSWKHLYIVGYNLSPVCPCMQEHLARFSFSKDAATRQSEVSTLFMNRWQWLHSPMHAAAYLLDPEYRTHWADLTQGPDRNTAGSKQTAKVCV